MRKKSENHVQQPTSTGRGSLFNKAKQEFYNLRAKILKQLAASKNSGSLIGVHTMALGEGTVISSVKDIYSDGNEDIVILKWYDHGSHIHSETHVSLDEITSVYPVSKSSRQPAYR
jgi:hypothetical protein